MLILGNMFHINQNVSTRELCIFYTLLQQIQWLGKLTVLNMTPLGWLGSKTSTQTQTNKVYVVPINTKIEIDPVYNTYQECFNTYPISLTPPTGKRVWQWTYRF